MSQFIDQYISQVYRTVHLRWRTTCSQPVTVWMKRANQAAFDVATAVQFTPVADGEWHVSVSSLSSWLWYGYIDYLGLQLPAGCEGESIDIDWLRLSSIYTPWQGLRAVAYNNLSLSSLRAQAKKSIVIAKGGIHGGIREATRRAPVHSRQFRN